jgi:hypothetical protein
MNRTVSIEILVDEPAAEVLVPRVVDSAVDL